MPDDEDVLTTADRLWRGETRTTRGHVAAALLSRRGWPRSPTASPSCPPFANVSAIDTDDGLVLVDTGSTFVARQVHGALRSWTTSRLHTAVYSHGHVDHVFGVPVWEAGVAEAAAGPRRWSSPTRPSPPASTAT